MEDYGRRPERRVFHIDSECYVVYVGRTLTDYRPFVRIGNSRELPENVKSLIYSIVVSDIFPGSPLLEQHNLDLRRSSDFRYVGDPRTVDRFKSFLQHREIPSEGYQTVADESPEDSGAYVYFYEDANVRLKMDHRAVFDLFKHAKQDLHYSERAEQISHALRRDPVHIGAENLQGMGCVMAGGKVQIFQEGGLLATDLGEEYFRELALVGVDPDTVRTVIAEEAGEGLVRLFKRAARTAQPLVIGTANGKGLRNLVDLFAGATPHALKAQFVAAPTGKWLKLASLRLRRGAGQGEELLSVEYEGARLALFENNAEPNSTAKIVGVGVDCERRVLVAKHRGETTEFTLREGVPYRLQVGVPEPAELVETALKVAGFEDSGLMTESERQGLVLLREAFLAVGNATEFKQAFAELPAGLMTPRNDPQSLYPLFLHNALSVADAGMDSGKQVASYRKLRELLNERAESAPEPAPELTHGVTVYLDAKRVYLVAVPHPALSRGNLSQTAAARRRIRAVMGLEEREHSSERSRLKRLIDELDTELARRKRPKEEATSQAGAAATKGMTLREQAAARAAARAEADAASRSSAASTPVAKDRSPAAGTRSAVSESSSSAASTSDRTPSAGSTSAASTSLKVSVGSTGRGRGKSSSSRGLVAVAMVAGGLVLLLLLLLLLRVPLPGPLERMAAGVRGETPLGAPDAPEGPAVPATGEPEDTAVLPESRMREAEDIELDAEPSTDDGQDPTADAPPEPDVARDLSDEPVDSVTQALLSFNIRPSIGDIILWTNTIAATNSFRTMNQPKGEVPGLGPDPDWIFPGNSFELPDGSVHLVRRGDTLCGIATDFIVEQLYVDFSEYLRLTSLYVSEEVGEFGREQILTQLGELRDQSPSESFRSFMDERIRELN